MHIRSSKIIAIFALAAVLASCVVYIAVSNLSAVSVNATTSPPETNAMMTNGDVKDTKIALKNNNTTTTTSSSNMTSNNQSAMLARGNIAMGFDQTKIMHHFMATPTGGQIMVIALNSKDNVTISQIKAHIADIQQEFSQGNFTKPFFIHAQEVPGTKVMTEKKDLIKYSVQYLNNGAILILTTDDPDLRQAIQQFMEFQGTAHHGH
jgi:hypothetical protein